MVASNMLIKMEVDIIGIVMGTGKESLNKGQQRGNIMLGEGGGIWLLVDLRIIAREIRNTSLQRSVSIMESSGWAKEANYGCWSTLGSL
jgi:hypothetical protein